MADNIWYSLGCVQWRHAVGWSESESCCKACHQELAHVVHRTFDSYNYSVCCSVKALCLKQLQVSQSLKDMPFAEWCDKWGIPKGPALTPEPLTIQAWLDTSKASGEVLTDGAGYEIIITNETDTVVPTTIDTSPIVY